MSWRTLSFLLSRRGSLEFKRLHVKKVLYTPGLSYFPRSFKVFDALLTDEVLVQKGFEPEEFMEGAREGYPLVARLMLGLDPEFEGASDFDHLFGCKRRLRRDSRLELSKEPRKGVCQPLPLLMRGRELQQQC